VRRSPDLALGLTEGLLQMTATFTGFSSVFGSDILLPGETCGLLKRLGLETDAEQRFCSREPARGSWRTRISQQGREQARGNNVGVSQC